MMTPETFVLKVVRTDALVRLGNLKVLNDPSYSRVCGVCKKAVAVSSLAVQMLEQSQDVPASFMYACQVCAPTPVPGMSPPAPPAPPLPPAPPQMPDSAT